MNPKMAPQRLEKKLKDIASKARRGYAADLKQTRFMLELLQAHHSKTINWHRMAEEKAELLADFLKSPMSHFSKEGYAKKYEKGRLVILWRTNKEPETVEGLANEIQRD